MPHALTPNHSCLVLGAEKHAITLVIISASKFPLWDKRREQGTNNFERAPGLKNQLHNLKSTSEIMHFYTIIGAWKEEY